MPDLTTPRSDTRPFALMAVLGALTAIAPLAIDMYVPGLPEVATGFDVDPASVQLTMTAILIGMAIGQLVIGPISDSTGRRALLIAGSLGFILFTLGCALAPSVEVLLVGRFLQGVAGAAGMVLARAVVLDRFDGPQIPQYMAMLSQILSIAPIVAPVIGGVTLAVSSWRTIFLVLAFIGALLACGVVTAVPESLPPERRHPNGLAGSIRSMRGLLTSRPFLGYMTVLGLGSACMFAYIGGSAFVFQDVHNLSAGFYSLVFATNALGALGGGITFGVLARRLRLNSLLVAAVAVATTGCALGLATTVLVGETVAGTWTALFVVMCGIGALIPATFTLGQSVGREASGAASALLGGAQVAFGAVAAPVVGAFGVGSSLPMTLVMMSAMALASVATAVLVEPHRGHGETVWA